MKFIFFGTPDRAEIVLNELKKQDLLPLAIVTNPDRPTGRKQKITESPASMFANQNVIPCHKPASKVELMQLKDQLFDYSADFFVVVAYGMIMPIEILEIPAIDAINIHYSLLPKWRGASPVVQQILHNEDQVGFTIMKMVAKMDAGGIYHQVKYPMPQPLPTTEQLAQRMSRESGNILPKIMNQIKDGNLLPIEQKDSEATYCTKLSKADGEISTANLLRPETHYKTRAFTPWPKTYFVTEKNDRSIRVVINETKIESNQTKIVSVTPAGKKSMSADQFNHWLGQDLL